MKKIILVMLALPMIAFAHGNTVDATMGAVTEVLKQFKANESADVQKNFRGIKAWPNQDEILAKVYVLGQDNKEIPLSYNCKMDHSGGHDAIVCQKQ